MIVMPLKFVMKILRKICASIKYYNLLSYVNLKIVFNAPKVLFEANKEFYIFLS